MIRTKEEAQSDLSEFAGLLFDSVRQGLRDFLGKYGPLRHVHRRRTDANVINDLIVDQLKRSFSDARGVEYRDKHASFRLGFFGRWTVKVKKLDSSLRTSNVETQSVLDFVNQRAVAPELPGAEGPTHLHLGYQRRHSVELEHSAVFLVCPNGATAAWDWELHDEGAGGLFVPAQPEAPQVDQPRTRLVRPRQKPDETADKAADSDALNE